MTVRDESRACLELIDFFGILVDLYPLVKKPSRTVKRTARTAKSSGSGDPGASSRVRFILSLPPPALAPELLTLAARPEYQDIYVAFTDLMEGPHFIIIWAIGIAYIGQFTAVLPASYAERPTPTDYLGLADASAPP